VNLARIKTRLRELSKTGFLAKSACSLQLLSYVAALLDSDVLAWERSGAGQRLVVRDPLVLDLFIAGRFPFAESQLPADLMQRVAAVACFRDSKAIVGDTPNMILLRAWSDSVLWCNDQLVPVTEATRLHGVFSFTVTPQHVYELRGACALIENPAVLFGFERLTLCAEVPVALYGGGRISARMLGWLSEQPAPNFQVIHLPDYDPMGLSEFVRLRNRLGDRLTLYLPSNLSDCFARFGNSELLRFPRSQSLLAKLRLSPISELRAVIDLIDRHHAGLEQEALLLDVARNEFSIGELRRLSPTTAATATETGTGRAG